MGRQGSRFRNRTQSVCMVEYSTRNSGERVRVRFPKLSTAKRFMAAKEAAGQQPAMTRFGVRL